MEWRETPPADRVQPLFRLKALLERDFEELSRSVTLECGKTLAEARGEVRRAIENVEVACGIPSLMQGRALEDIARGIDEFMLRQPVGVAAVIAPFNFPAMIPFWFLPYALACGNAVVVKPSEKTPLTMHRVTSLLDEAGVPPGVVQVVHGGRDAVEALLDHPDIAAVSFVGSSPVARSVYERAGPVPGSGSSARAARRIRSWCSRTPTSTPPRGPSQRAPSAARGSAASPPRWR